MSNRKHSKKDTTSQLTLYPFLINPFASQIRYLCLSLFHSRYAPTDEVVQAMHVTSHLNLLIGSQPLEAQQVFRSFNQSIRFELFDLTNEHTLIDIR